ncbi:MAG: PEP-utilizing enzyme [Myxococcota bacterium]|nr:PEP-utilizing enzyme [Myxococcota bacterium]
MHAAEGVLTSRGGMTSHAAVVARGWGKPCVAGCSDIAIDYREKKTLKGGDVVLREGDWISLNGTTGEVISGKADLADALVSGELAAFMEWVDEVRTIAIV